MSYRKNATTLVLRPTRTKSQRDNAQKATTVMMVPRRSQRSFLNQAPTKGPEQKSFDTKGSFTANAFSAWSSIQVLNTMVNGTGAADRIGRRVTITKIMWRGIMIAASSSGPSQMRVLIVFDKQPNGALAAKTDIVLTDDFTSYLALRNSQRFVVVCDEITDSTQSSALNISDKRFIKCNLETTYTTTLGTIADIETGALLMMVAHNGGFSLNSTSNFDATVRIRFTDQ